MTDRLHLRILPPDPEDSFEAEIVVSLFDGEGACLTRQTFWPDEFNIEDLRPKPTTQILTSPQPMRRGWFR